MAVDAYMTTAASQLHSAVSALQDEIKRIQADAYDNERQMQAERSRAEYDLVNIRAELNAVNDDNLKRELRAREQQLQSTINQKNADTSKQSSNAANEVKKRNDVLSKAQNLASQLESLASAAR